jgi:hypothetical protein
MMRAGTAVMGGLTWRATTDDWTIFQQMFD